MKWRKVIPCLWVMVFDAISSALVIVMPALGQTVPQVQEIREVWQGVVLNSDFHEIYTLSAFGLAELQSPHPYQNSEYFAGLRVSRQFLTAYRFGIECLQDREYLSNTGLFLENRCSLDLARKWSISPRTRFFLRPKLECRRFGGMFDQRLKIQAELLHAVHPVRATFRAFIEPAIDQQFHGFEKLTIHTGMLWPAGKRVKVEVFNSVSVGKKPDYGIEAIGMVIFVQLRNKGRAGGEINR
jgi:hypothetical protein